MDSDENAWNYQQAVPNLNDNLNQTANSEKLTLCKSVACVVDKELLGTQAHGGHQQPIFGYFKNPAYYVKQRKWEDYICEKALGREVTKLDQISTEASFKFKGERIVGTATGYYIGNNILVTSGHVAAQTGGFDVEVLKGILFIFGLTKDKYEDQGNGAPNPIPLENIWEFDRILYCQHTVGGKDYVGVPVPQSDCTDWALVLIKPYNNHTFPAPPALDIFPPQESYESLDGAQDIFVAGHPMGTALKLSVPPPVSEYQGSLKFGTRHKQPDYKEYVGALLHNVLTQRGNSGSPLFCKFKNIDHYEVVGTMQSSVALSDLEAAGFVYNSGGPVVKQIRPPKLGNYPFYFRAARNELWYYLVNRQSCFFVILELAKPNAMTANLRLELILEDNKKQKHVFFLADLQKLPKRQKFVFDFSQTVAGPDFLPCHTRGIQLTYGASSGQVIQQPQQAKRRRGAPDTYSPDTPLIVYLAAGFGHPRMLSAPNTGKHFPVLLYRHAKFTTTQLGLFYVSAGEPLVQEFQFNLPHSTGLYQVEDPDSPDYDESVSIEFQKQLLGQ